MPSSSAPRLLLVEDNPGDVRLTQEALKQGDLSHELDVATDGEQALDYLFQRDEYEGQPRPDLVLLDLNLPKCDGREVLRCLKEDETLRQIPVVILTTSEAEQDIEQTYELNANCYITKPVDLDDFMQVVRTVEDFWLGLAELPSGARV
jgi:CheY-like chemotaxis protein